MTHTPSAASPLPPDIAALLTELAAALNRRGMYPAGHPALAQAARAVAARAAAPLEARGEVVLAVARDRIMHGDEASDPSQPMLRDLADRLHRRRIGGVRLRRGFDEAEAGALLDVLAPEPDPESGGPAPWSSRACALLPARYDRLALAGEGGPAPSGAAAVWGDLARSALGGEGAAASAVDLARAINERRGDAAFDGAIAARLTGLLGRMDPQASPELAPDLAELLRRLDPDRLRRLLQLAGRGSQVNEILRVALRTLPADAVLALLKAARGPRQSISDSLMRILGKLSLHAPHLRTEDEEVSADAALREQVEELVTGWQLDDPNPEAYTEALQSLAAHRTGRPSVPTSEHRPAPARVVGMALELGATGPVCSRALEELCSGEPVELIRLLSMTPGGTNEARDEGWRLLLSPAALARILDGAEPGDATVEGLLARAGAAAIDPLLDRLAASEQRAERRWLLDRLVAIGPGIGPAVARRLRDAPWYLVRNLLYLLRQTGSGADIDPDLYLTHEDPRVRIEALRLFAPGPARERALAGALRDEDPAVVSAGLALAVESCPPSAVPLLARRAADAGLPDDVRSQAVRLAAEYPTRAGLEALTALAIRGRTLFRRRPKFADPSPVSLAALAALFRGWPDDETVGEIRSAARAAKHGAIRAAAREVE